MDTVKVKIINEIFKNGVFFGPGTETELELQTAFRFQKAGDLQILDEIDTEVREIEVARKV